MSDQNRILEAEPDRWMMRTKAVRGRLYKRRISFWGMILALFLSPSALAQDGRLNVDLAGSSPRVRANAPVMLLLKAYWNGSSIVEGRFEVRYYADGHNLRSESVSHEVVLAPGEQTIRLTLPTVGSNVSFGQDEIALKFVTEAETFDLKRYPLATSNADRTMNVCLVGPTDRDATTMAEKEITDALRLGDVLADRIPPGSVATVYTRWDNADVPEQPLHFCSFDLILLRPEGLADLRQKQIDALLAWVRAGGSICVLLSQDIDGKHVDFLNALVSESVESPFVLNTSGVLVADQTTANQGMWQAHAELGRAVIFDLEEVSGDSETIWNQARRAAGFMWKLRQGLRHSNSRLSKWQLDQRRKQVMARSVNRYRQMAWQPLGSVGRFVSELMPEDVSVVPIGLIGVILVGYLVLIGPFDYFFLGYLKQRRYTWITFPLMTVAVTFFCVWMSEYFLSSKTSGRNLVIRDIGADGTILRESRFDLMFLSRRREITTEVQNAIFTPLDSERLMLGSRYAYQLQYQGQPAPRKQNRFQGRIPDSYEVKQVVSQWKPEVNRWFMIAPDRPKVEGFDWNNTDLLRPRMEDALRREIVATWPEATAILYRSGARYVTSRFQMFSQSEFHQPDQYRFRPVNGQRHDNVRFENGLCERPRSGFFEFVSQLSPTGGDNFEDLALLDATDSGQAVLLIAVREDDALVLYRRLYTGLDKN